MSTHNSCENNTHPLALAEELCGLCLQRGANALSAGNNRRLLLAKAWMFTELTLADKDRPGVRLRLAQHLLGQIATEPFSPEATKAIFAEAYMHALPDRRLSRPISPKNKALANRGFAAAIHYTLEGKRKGTTVGGVDIAAGHAAEGLALYLMSRPSVERDQFLHVASPREEDAVLRSYNHDAYQLIESDEKTYYKYPLQFKLGRDFGVLSPAELRMRRKEADAKYDVPVLRIHEVLTPVMEAIGTDSLNNIMQFAVTESTEGVGYYETTALDFASFSLQNAINTERYRTTLAQGFGLPHRNHEA